jgi:hypothetical protein
MHAGPRSKHTTLQALLIEGHPSTAGTVIWKPRLVKQIYKKCLLVHFSPLQAVRLCRQHQQNEKRDLHLLRSGRF